MTAEYYEGVDAYLNGTDEHSNPHSLYSYEYNEWRDGWVDARFQQSLINRLVA